MARRPVPTFPRLLGSRLRGGAGAAEPGVPAGSGAGEAQAASQQRQRRPSRAERHGRQGRAASAQAPRSTAAGGAQPALCARSGPGRWEGLVMPTALSGGREQA